MITRIENRDSGWKDAMKSIYPDTGATLVFGITGAPGAGKSTLTSKIAQGFVTKGYQVGIIAVDPSSPFSGGSLLGDRLRMQDIATIQGIFIRFMATRGTLGGLCQGARDVIRLMDAFGKDIVLIETVGVGQEDKQRQARDDETRIREEVLTLMEQELFHHIRSLWAGNGALQAAVNRIIDGEQDPYSVVEDMLSTIKKVEFETVPGKDRRGERK